MKTNTVDDFNKELDELDLFIDFKEGELDVYRNSLFTDKVILPFSLSIKQHYIEAKDMKKHAQLAVTAIASCLGRKSPVLIMTTDALEKARKSDKTWRNLRIKKPNKINKNDLVYLKKIMETSGFVFDLIKTQNYKVNVVTVPLNIYNKLNKTNFTNQEYENLKESSFKEITEYLYKQKNAFLATDSFSYKDIVKIIKNVAKKNQSPEVFSVLADLVRQIENAAKSGQKLGNLSNRLDQTNTGDSKTGNPTDNADD